MLEDHLDGLSFRALGDKYSVSKTTAWKGYLITISSHINIVEDIQEC